MVIYCQVKRAYGIIWIYVDWDPAMGFSDLEYEKELHYNSRIQFAIYRGIAQPGSAHPWGG